MTEISKDKFLEMVEKLAQENIKARALLNAKNGNFFALGKMQQQLFFDTLGVEYSRHTVERFRIKNA